MSVINILFSMTDIGWQNHSQGLLLRHPLLSSLGLVVDPILQAVCCESCKVALEPKHLASHIRKTHGFHYIHIDTAKLINICTELGAMEELPSVEGDVIQPQFAGLAIHNGIGCRHCHYVCISETNMKKHHLSHHCKMGAATSWLVVKIQQLDKQTHKTFFRVQPWDKMDVVSDDDYLRNLKELMEVIEQEYEEGGNDARQISPWLLSTRWHEHIEGYDTKELRELVKVPSKDEFPGLREGLEHLFALALEAVDELPELVLQKLNTPDPAKT
jgi:Orsellinic acid/F9775 biosynthesis cluster protein D